MFTDTDCYTGIIPECTNLSVGYFKAHTANEWVDWEHLDALRDVLVSLDVSDLPVKRDPDVVEEDGFSFYSRWEHEGLDDWYRGHEPSMSERERLIRNNAAAVSKFLEEWGVDDGELQEVIFHHSGGLVHS